MIIVEEKLYRSEYRVDSQGNITGYFAMMRTHKNQPKTYHETKCFLEAGQAEAEVRIPVTKADGTTKYYIMKLERLPVGHNNYNNWFTLDFRTDTLELHTIALPLDDTNNEILDISEHKRVELVM